METRLERNKRLRKQNRLRRFCLFILFILLVIGIDIVNQSFVELNSLDNQRIVGFDIKTGEFCILGKTYFIDLSFLKKLYLHYFYPEP